MGDRMDELKGNLKQGIGKVSGQRDMEAEGTAESDTAHTKREIKGTGSEIKGRVEEGVGNVTDDDETQGRGMLDRLKGKGQQAG